MLRTHVRGAAAALVTLGAVSALAALLAVGFSPPAGAQGSARGTIWVANEGGDSVSVIDAATNRVVATLTGIAGPHNLQASADGASVWAVSGHASLAAMIDARKLRLHGVVRTGKEPAHVIVTPDGRKAYVTNGGADTVTAIDVATMKPVATIPVGRFPHGLRPSPDGRLVYVANAKGKTVSVIDVASDRRVADIAVGDGPVQVAFAPSGRFAYVSLNHENAIGKIDVARRRLVAKVRVGIGPIQVFVSPDGKELLAANQGTEQAPSTTLSIVDTGRFAVVGTVETGKGAHGVVVDPSSRYAYVTNIYGGDVAVVDLVARKVAARVPVGREPNGISFSRLTTRPVARTAIDLGLAHMPATMTGMGH